jgi:hypothetical protein
MQQVIDCDQRNQLLQANMHMRSPRSCQMQLYLHHKNTLEATLEIAQQLKVKNGSCSLAVAFVDVGQ